ncbi:hypothetical protein GCM10010313_80970 [Streptomyces violarus]|uniref:Putative unusual protein kinase regulating ubiquinone biosynthesis (AarF/ABC1/UbiB family) n=1 Tax=Streptomyces violarus TaxID=67380 RepID=A0A7W4ZXY7_9ACTN|nr:MULTISPECIES: hypothetical protein [Streptomyces]MBB3080825.1 putative unusual protein kinase regulating ubiquinone biosynthesis (AarF/ABC1/UbiB family) [Streptomyces violarus]WRT96189.1 hypothetical protein VJ737_00120 [Streptomyces sp. CGMCC 4.1772]GHD34399.1 hypothetical protein GCM10010313_80970 [Streptomyces violarus]
MTLTAVLQHSTRRGIRTGPMVSILGKSFANIEGSIRHLCPELSLIDVFSKELVGIVTDLIKESLSPQQAVRSPAWWKPPVCWRAPRPRRSGAAAVDRR